jgi:hypothetical protein
MWNRRTRSGALLAGALLLAACDDATGPDLTETFDAEAALADYRAMEEILQSGAFAGFRSLDGRTPFSGSAAMGVASSLDADPKTFAFEVLRRGRAALDARGPDRAPLISEGNRGSTFVYDPVSDDYVLAPDRDGAPATGVRFILYEVDASGTPIVEREIGYADLIDEGDQSAEKIALRLVGVANGRTHIDYRTTLDGDEARGTLTVAGFIQGDDEPRLDFDVRVAGRNVDGREEIDLDFDLDVASRDFEIDGRVRGMGEDDAGEIDVKVRHRSDSFQLVASVANRTFEGTIRLNGELFATASGPADDPIFLNAEGGQLSGVEALVLLAIADSVEDVFDLVEDLVDPVDNLVIIGALL